MRSRRDLPPRWTVALLRRLARAEAVDEALGDLEEAHRARLARDGWLRANVLTALEALDMARALLRERRRGGTARSAAPVRHEVGGSRARLSTISWLDVKLGLRMLVKHPGLSLVSALGMAVAVGIGTTAFAAIRAVTASRLPLDEGDRIVTIQNTGWGGLGQARATHLHDLPTWREASRTIGAFGAYRIITKNLVAGDGEVTPARVVEMTASGFAIARVPPLLGRPLIEADEDVGAPAVAVIGHGVWQDRYGGRTDVVGHTLQIGSTLHTIVGVMPQGFAFPINNRVWTPLRLDPLEYERGLAPPLDVFGRLASGVTLEEAQSELTLLGQRAAGAYPDTHEELSPKVFPYASELFWGPLAWFLYLAQAVVSLLLVVIAINVAALVYARTATRSGEIVMRSALGASRARIASQLFAEAFVVSSAAAMIGLVLARWGLEQVELEVVVSGGEQVPFWWDFSLSSASALYSLGLAVMAAVIIGVVPALGMTGRRLRTGLQGVGSGTSGPRLGRTWTALIVAQVAVAVAVLPVGLSGIAWLLVPGQALSRAATVDFLVADLAFEEVTAAGAEPKDLTQARLATMAALEQRLLADSEVSRVLMMQVAPWSDPDVRFELEGGAPTEGEAFAAMESAATGQLVGVSRVGPDFFSAFGFPLLTGRVFDATDVASGSGAVVVNQVFVEQVLKGGDAVGRRIRFPGSSTPAPSSEQAAWYTIVGVIQDQWGSHRARPEAKAFAAMIPGERVPGDLAVRVRSETTSFERRLRKVAAGVDPTLQLSNVKSLNQIYSEGEAAIDFLALTVWALALSVLMLSVAGLYALMSFTVVRRRREIGIRAALGARPHAVVRSVLSRAMAQLALGIVVGVTLAGLADRALGGEMLSGRGGLLLPLVAALMVAIGLMAAWGPARRGLRIQPTEALRGE